MSDDSWPAKFPVDGFPNDVIEGRLRWKQRSLFFLNSEHGINMAIDASASGATEPIHDGTDASLWTASNIVGSKVTFDSTDTPTVSGGTWPTNGTRSIKVANPNLNDAWEFDAGGDITISTYDVLRANINIASAYSVGDSISIYGWDTGLGQQVGDSVLLETYINESVFDIIQVMNIPLSDMGLTSGTVDAFRMELIGKDGPAPTLYIDQLLLSESATLVYTAQPATGKIVRYTHLEMTVCDNITVLEPQKFMGLTLSGGLMFQRFENNVPGPAVNFRSLLSMMLFTFDIPADSRIFGASETVIKIVLKLPSPVTLIQSRGDRVEFTLEDDFSGLISMSAIVIGKELIE